MTFIDQSIALVRRAARAVGKKPLADRIGKSDAILRNVENQDWNPTASTLRQLEVEAAKELENGAENSEVAIECEGGGPVTLTRRGAAR